MPVTVSPIQPPTDDEIQRVRDYECSRHGHVFDTVLARGSHHPGAVRCLHCTRVWPVMQLRRNRTV